MDLLKNPFHILGATTRDDKIKIMDLAEKCSLLSDANECMDAQSTLIRPQNRISAEIAWLPGVNPEHIDSLLKQLDSPHQNLLNITDLPPLARANLLTARFSHLTNIASANIVEWILAIADAYERIDAEEVRITLNEERNISGFPQITDISVITAEIQNQRRYYSQTLSSVINNLSVTEHARMLTSTLEIVMGNGNNRCPMLIDDLIKSYEVEVGNDLEKKQKIIEAQDKKLRVMVDAKNPDTTLQPIVNQLLETVKEWDIIAQPIQLNKRSKGERHDVSFEVAWRVQKLAVYLFNEYRKFDFSLQLLNMLLEVFAEVPEIVERITIDKKNIEAQIPEIKGIEKFEEINTQVEKLKEAADAKRSDTTLAPMVSQLIQTVKTWETSGPPIWANEVVAYSVRSIALHLWNEHRKLAFAIKITTTLIEHFKDVNGMNEVNSRLSEDIVTLNGIKPQKKQVPPSQPKSGKGFWWVWICLILIGIVVYSVIQEDFSYDEVKYPNPQGVISENGIRHTDPQGEINSFNELPMPIPVSGYEESFHNKVEVAPLQIKTPTYRVEHHFIKIVHAIDGNTVKTIFMRSGDTINTKMPLGSYNLKYATGKTWYGKEHLFGPETIYSKANKTFIFSREVNGYLGYTIELILQQGGNLRTQSIPKSDW